MDRNETGEDFKHLEVASGYCSFAQVARDFFVVSPQQLRNTDAFADYRCSSADLIPLNDLRDIVTECFSANSPVFLRTMVLSAGYGTTSSFQRAVNSSGMNWPVNKDFAVWWMEQSSYEAGPMGVRQITTQRQLASREALTREVRVIDVSSGSVR